MQKYLPEGMLIDRPDNKAAQRSLATLEEAMRQQKILEARAIVCDAARNLWVQFDKCKGVIYHDEAAHNPDGGEIKDITIISRVNHPVCFVVTGFEAVDGETVAVLSRRQVQAQCQTQYIMALTPGDIISGKVTHLEKFGAFVDIGCGLTALLPANGISVSRIAHPKDRLCNGMEIKAVVASRDEFGRIVLTMRELLGTWEENAKRFNAGDTVAGIVRSVESYGIFVELAPNLTGLAEFYEGAVPGQQASVYIKSIIPEKMKVKLIIIDAFEAGYLPEKLQYYTDQTHMESWQYSPAESDRVISTIFN